MVSVGVWSTWYCSTAGSDRLVASRPTGFELISDGWLGSISPLEIRPISGVFRISKRGGGKCSMDTSAHTKGGRIKFSNFFTMSKNLFG